jgi:hypothetical protein
MLKPLPRSQVDSKLKINPRSIAMLELEGIRRALLPIPSDLNPDRSPLCTK